MGPIRPLRSADLSRFGLSPTVQRDIGFVYGRWQMRGYCELCYLPGIPDERELYGLVLPNSQRQGIGTALWQQCLQSLVERSPQNQVRRVSCAVKSLDGPAAHFLRAQQFEPAFAEWEMALTDLSDVPPTDVTLVQRPQDEAATLFHRLHPLAFSGLPWYQPYNLVDDVWDDWGDNDQWLFLEDDGEPIGFVWLRFMGQTATIEPIGIAQARQGEGFGRKLLHATLRHLQSTPVNRVSLGVHADNQTAIQLYQSVGFTQTGTTTFFALDLISK